MKKIIAILLLSVPTLSHSQDLNITADTTIIENKYDAELDKAKSDIESAMVVGNAMDSYDKLLNKYYNACVKKLTGIQKTNLINAQKAWIVFRNNEFKYLDKKYAGGPGSGLSFALSDKLDFIKRRVVELFNHWEMII